MKDKDFVQSVQEKLHELHVHRIELDEKARIANICLKNFKPTLLDFLNNCNNSIEEKIYFTREMIISEPCDYNLRQGMDNDLIVEIVRKGYRYIEEESTSSELVFQKIA